MGRKLKGNLRFIPKAKLLAKKALLLPKKKLTKDEEGEESNDDEEAEVMTLDVEESSTDEEDQTEDKQEETWGNKKSYYGADVQRNNRNLFRINMEEEDLMQDEENEVKQLQKKKAASMTAQDFDDDLPESFASKLKATTDSAKQEQKGNKEEVEGEDEAVLTAETAESVEKDTSSLSTEEKLQLIMTESPELLQLLEEFKVNINELRDKLQPVIQKVKEQQLTTTKGLSYLETKYHLLLSYCINIVFYLLLKSHGASVKQHPVIDQLVKIRTVLEKLRPLDKKLAYQIDKLLKQATLGEVDSPDADPRAHKPNPDMLELDEDEDQAPTDLYKAPKLIEMPFVEPSASQRRREEYQRRRVASSKLLKEIREEYGEEPIEEPNIGADQDEDQDDRKRTEFEESAFIRTVLSKEEKQKKAKKKQREDDLQSLLDFGDIARIDRESEAAQRSLKKKNIQTVLEELQREDEEEQEEAHQKRKKGKNQPDEEEEEMEEANDDLIMDGIDDEEDEAPKKKVKFSDTEGTDRRKITHDIKDNRGLTRSRNRETKTPRTKHRNKYTKAMSRRRSAVRDMLDRSKPYGGEKTGISKNVTRSVKLKI